ncbi:MAG: hypothetical protein ACTSRN_06305 [Alphaproteobacteria bacterium]
MAHKLSLETLEKRIAALETLASEPSVRASSISSGFLSGLSHWQMFLLEAELRFNEIVPVNPFPDVPPPRPPTACERECRLAFSADLINANWDPVKVANAVADRDACLGKCHD